MLALLLLKLLRCVAMSSFFRSKSLLQVCNLRYLLVREAGLSQQLESDRFRLVVNLCLLFFDRGLGDLSIIQTWCHKQYVLALTITLRFSCVLLNTSSAPVSCNRWRCDQFDTYGNNQTHAVFGFVELVRGVL